MAEPAAMIAPAATPQINTSQRNLSMFMMI